MNGYRVKEVQSLIRYLIGEQLEQMAVHELKGNSFYINYFSDWKDELEELFKKNSILIKQAKYELVEEPERRQL